MKQKYMYTVKEEGDNVTLNTKSLVGKFSDSATITVADKELRSDFIHLLGFPMEEYAYGLYEVEGALPGILNDTLEQAKAQFKNK